MPRLRGQHAPGNRVLPPPSHLPRGAAPGKTITCFGDLAAYGIEPLTGESCGLVMRILCDVTAGGLKIAEKCLGCRITPAEVWNRGDPTHVGSRMLSPEFLVPLGLFALLESGCRVVWLTEDRGLIGFEPGDEQRDCEGTRILRTYSYGGTAGDRNVHRMSGRIE